MKRVTLHSFEIEFGREPPKEFRVFKWGVNTTLKGDFTLTRELALEMLEEVADHGIELMIDYDHLSLEPKNPGDGKASGWYQLEIRGDGLWATNVRWTKAATQMLSEAEYRFFSPAFLTDEDDQITTWVNMALTNLPATDHQKPLVAASRKLKEIIMKTQRRLSKMPHASLAEHLGAHMKMNDMSVEEMAKHCGMDQDRMKAIAAGESFPTKDEGKKLTKHLGMKDAGLVKYSEAFDTKKDESPKESGDDEENDSEADEEKTSETADDEDESSEDDSDDSDDEEDDVKKTSGRTELQELTGAKNPREARKAFLAIQAQANASTKLLARLEKIEKQSQEREVLSLVRQGIAEGKLAPAQKEWAMKLGSRDPEELRELLEVSPSHFDGEAITPVDLEETDDTFGGSRGGQSMGKDIEKVVSLMSQHKGHPALDGKVNVTADMVKARAKKGYTPRSA